MTVYVVQEHRRYDRDTGEYVPVYDLSPAQEYGELKFLLSPTAGPWCSESIIKELWEGLAQFTPDDYLLMIGNPVLCSWATAIAADIIYEEGRPLKFLQWNGKQKQYTPLEANLFPLDSGTDTD